MENAKVYLREKQKFVTVPVNPEFAERVDELILEKWQQMINLVADIFEVKAGLIMRITKDNMEVFLRSNNEDNPYAFDGKDQLGHGLYCETVIGEDRELYVDNSLHSEIWQNNPDVKLDMIAYYGLPIKNPDGSFFGTICALDNKTMPNSEKYRGLLEQFRSSMETDLRILQINDELEQRVKERTAQLEASNKELENFAYSISHELRSPLRAMSGFSEILLRDYESRLDEKGGHYLKRIFSAAERMGQLIDDLLHLAKVTRMKLAYEKVDLSQVAQELMGELKKSEPERRVQFCAAEGLTAQGDAELIKVVLDNLLSNAWKFTADTDEAVIELGKITAGDEIVYFVRDNGSGFNENYAEKVFGAFHRLHGIYEFSGTGAGLAVAQRIIHRHGGEIWAEGEEGKGATFYFTLGDSKKGL